MTNSFCLNVPRESWVFSDQESSECQQVCLNAPSGAECFLDEDNKMPLVEFGRSLCTFLVLGASDAD